MKEIALMALAFIGFSVSFYIFYSKKYGKPLYCFSKAECDAVVRSKYGKTFGFENTIPGMVYYIAIFAYGILLNRNVFIAMPVYYVIVGISIASVLFSLYLVYVQKFILKKWCVYCLISTVASIIILGVLV